MNFRNRSRGVIRLPPESFEENGKQVKQEHEQEQLKFESELASGSKGKHVKSEQVKKPNRLKSELGSVSKPKLNRLESSLDDLVNIRKMFEMTINLLCVCLVVLCIRIRSGEKMVVAALTTYVYASIYISIYFNFVSNFIVSYF